VLAPAALPWPCTHILPASPALHITARRTHLASQPTLPACLPATPPPTPPSPAIHPHLRGHFAPALPTPAHPTLLPTPALPFCPAHHTPALHTPALPQPYSATDHTKYGKKAKKCPAEGYCVNCMPLQVRREGGRMRGLVMF
jgi:hypothetical protein